VRARLRALLRKPGFFRQPVLFETDAAGLFDPAAKIGPLKTAFEHE
jgi:hypothetical protein